jgi:hypothetical protein
MREFELIRVPELTGRLSGFGLKQFGKMGGVLKTQLISYLTDRFFRAPEHRFCSFDQFEVDMLLGGLTREFL